MAERERWLREQSQTLEVDVELLLPVRERPHETDVSTEEQEDEEDSAVSLLELYTEESAKFQTGDSFSDMLVFAPWTVDTIYDIFITDFPVKAHPAQKRGLPANAIYRYAKFALVHWDDDCLEWLVLGAVERIEKEIFVSHTWMNWGAR